jgi:acyl-CoA synthetase (NDP forming)
VLGFFTQVGGADSIAPKLREQMTASKARHPDRLFVLSVVAPPVRIREYEADGFTVFEDPTRATVAIHAMGRFGEAFAQPSGLPPPAVPAVELPPATPSEAAAKRMLAQAGIPAAPEAVCATPDAAAEAAGRIGFPVVLKVLSPDIIHKSAIGGVILDVHGAGAVRAGFATLLHRAAAATPSARIEGILVAKQLRGGIECILGIQRDPVFGPVAMVGLGGIFVEVLRDVALHRCPFGPDVAERMVRSLRAAPVLLGARGRPPADIAAISAMLSRLSVFAHQAGPRLRSVDLNPVFAMPNGEGAYVADAVIELGETA